MSNFELAKILFLDGCAFLEAKDFTKAESKFMQSLELLPNRVSTLTNLSAAQLKLQKYSEAKATAEKSILIDEENYEAYLNLDLIEKKFKRFDAAVNFFDKAISLKPNYAEAWLNKGSILNELRRHEEALAHYDKALSLNSDYADAWLNKGNSLDELKRHEEALAHHDKALSLQPNFAEAWLNKGGVLNELNRYGEAIDCYDKALSLKPDIDWIYGDLLHAKMKICNWSGLEILLEKVINKILECERVTTPFVLLSLTDDSLLHKKCAEILAEDKYPSNSLLGSISKTAENQKIRIAYFSPDFRSHPVSFLTAQLFEIHDKSRFETFAFSLKKGPVECEMNFRLRNCFDRFIEVEDLSDLEVTKLARNLKIDIVVDLAGLTQYSRPGIFSYRAAPIQLNWLGYPGTIGADFIDYIIADKTIIPEPHQHFYVEKVVYLPDTYMVDDSNRTASSRVYTKPECGLPENVFIFCCFNNDYKFNSQVLDSWARILIKAQNSVLWISENNEHFKTNITVEFERRGLDRSRLIFAERVELMEDHLARYALADLFLDTFPYNAHTTTIDSLKGGVPVLTRVGLSFASRVAASLLNAIKMPELITNSVEEYEALAIELATNPIKFREIKSKLVNNRFKTPLFDTPLFTKNLEDAYLKIHQRYQNGLKPDHISID